LVPSEPEFTRVEGHRIPATSSRYFVYILRCADGTFYVGHTADLQARVEAHSQGRGCGYTAARLPVAVAYSEPCDSLTAAVKREAQIKRWGGRKKAALVEQNTHDLRALSRRRKYAKKA